MGIGFRAVVGEARDPDDSQGCHHPTGLNVDDRNSIPPY